jgi:hypothetical protein
MIMVVALALGIPLVRAKIRREERHPLPQGDAQAAERLARIEAAVESIAIEVERISEAQRFTTKLLAERTSGPPTPERTP